MSNSSYRAMLGLLAGEKDAILYRPRFAKVVGSVTAAILLQQINYWWSTNKFAPFYKFRAECKHGLYKSGDSWAEELGFGEFEFDGALKRIATRVKPKDSKQSILDITEVELDGQGRMLNADKLVMYWTGQDHVTYYELNEALFAALIRLVYCDFPDVEIPNREIPNREKPNLQSGNSRLANREKPNPIEQRLPETTTEIEREIEAPAPVAENKVLDFRLTAHDELQEITTLKDRWLSSLDISLHSDNWLNTTVANTSLKRMLVAVSKTADNDKAQSKGYVKAVALRLTLQELEAYTDDGYPKPKAQPVRRDTGNGRGSHMVSNGARPPSKREEFEQLRSTPAAYQPNGGKYQFNKPKAVLTSGG